MTPAERAAAKKAERKAGNKASRKAARKAERDAGRKAKIDRIKARQQMTAAEFLADKQAERDEFRAIVEASRAERA